MSSMANRTEEFRELYAFNRWATQRILEAAAALPRDQFERDMGSSFRSIRDTLVHMMSAEWVWLARWNGSSPTAMPAEWKECGLPRIEEDWAVLDGELQRFVGALAESDVDRLIAYRNIAGEPFTTPLSQMLRHVVNHASYHRGQVVTMLRQLGAAAPATDLIIFCRSRSESVPAS
jgi:uncharacterized damage-inducible protein DinB